MELKNRIYCAQGISSIGNWVTFLAIALFVKEKYGVDQVAFTFLIQSIPPLFLSKGLSEIVTTASDYSVFISCQLLLAVNISLLAINPTIGQIYIYLVIASTLKTLTNPLMNSLIGQWIKKEELSTVFTRIGAINSITLAFAPMMGGDLSLYIGFNFLFCFDAMTFLLVVLFLFPKPITKYIPDVKDIIDVKIKLTEIFNDFHKRPKGVKEEMGKTFTQWYLFLSLGAFLNGVEFAVFEYFQMSKDQIGLTIGMWGAGNLLAFFIGDRFKRYFNLFNSGCFFVLSLILFLSGLGLLSILIGFFFGGMSNAFIGGLLRADLQSKLPQNIKPLEVWAYANQRMCLINIIFYGVLGLLITTVPFFIISLGMIFLGCIFIISLRTEKSF